ncbi:MAG: redoxin domain-containing protein [Verrucomicrobiota bacterium]|jgi:peroxiredoxin
MKRAVTLFSILGLAAAGLADPQTSQPSAQINSIIFPQLLSPAGSVLMTNAEFRLFSGGKIFFKNDNGYQSFHAADLNADVLAALHITDAQLEAQQKNLDAANKRYREEAAAAAVFGNPQIGRPGFNFTATDISGKKVSLGNYKGKIVVLETYYNGCPFCENHYKSGAMPELQRELATNGVVWLLINCARTTTAEAMQDRLNKKMAVSDWITDDSQSQIERAFALKTAPEAVVINTNGLLAYIGAMDDLAQKHPDALPGTLDPRTARNYVREAVRALLAGQPVPVPETKPYGCRLLYPGMPDENMFRPPAFLR